MNAVDEQYGSSTYTADLVPLLIDMIRTEKYGIYYVTNEGVCSWAEFVEEIFKVAGMNVKVNYITITEYFTKAKRTLNSRLSKRKIDNIFYNLFAWREALKFYINNCEEKSKLC